MIFWIAPPSMDRQWWWWWFHRWIHPLRPPYLQYSLSFGLIWIAGLRRVYNPLWGVGAYEVIVVLFLPMMRPRWDRYQGLLLPHRWWCILLVQVWCRKLNVGREMIFFPQLRCMLKQFARLLGHAGMKHQDLFSLSGCALMSNWSACIQSCGLSWGVIIYINMAGGCTSVPGFLQIVLWIPGRSSCGWRIFWCSALFSRLLISVLLPQAVRLLYFLCDGFSQLWWATLIHVKYICPLFSQSLPH